MWKILGTWLAKGAAWAIDHPETIKQVFDAVATAKAQQGKP